MMELNTQLIKLSEHVAVLTQYNHQSITLGCHAVLFVTELDIFSDNVPIHMFLNQQQIADSAFVVDNWVISRKIVKYRETTRGCAGRVVPQKSLTSTNALKLLILAKLFPR